jgi:hypothetical protein
MGTAKYPARGGVADFVEKILLLEAFKTPGLKAA